MIRARCSLDRTIGPNLVHGFITSKSQRSFSERSLQQGSMVRTWTMDPNHSRFYNTTRSLVPSAGSDQRNFSEISSQQGSLVRTWTSRENGVFVSKTVSLSPLFAPITAHTGLSWPCHHYIRWKAYFFDNKIKYYFQPRKLIGAICGGKNTATSLFFVKKCFFDGFCYLQAIFGGINTNTHFLLILTSIY